jgi:hypothetical protein
MRSHKYIDGTKSLTSLRPVVPRTTLAEDKVIGAEEGAQRTRADGVHGARLEINQDRARDVLVPAGFVVVHRDALELEIVVAIVDTIGADTVFVRNNFPEPGT